MKIAIIDHVSNRVIIAQVPEYLANSDYSSDDIAQAIFGALGISSGDAEYIIGEFDARVDGATYNEDKVAMYSIEELTQDFKEDSLLSLNEYRR